MVLKSKIYKVDMLGRSVDNLMSLGFLEVTTKYVEDEEGDFVEVTATTDLWELVEEENDKIGFHTTHQDEAQDKEEVKE